MDTADALLAAQTVLLAVSTFFTWRTILDAGRERERERQEARHRAEEAQLEAVAHAALAVYEAAEVWRAKRPEGAAQFEPAQKRLAYALTVAPSLAHIEALADMVAESAAAITGDLITQALDEVKAAYRELRQS